MSTPRLRFNTTPYHGNQVGNLLLVFREQGYTILPDVFEPTSVDEYLAQIGTALIPGDQGRLTLPPSPLRIVPTRAPRILQVVRALYQTAQMHPNVSIFEIAWLISPSEKPNAIVDSWHKDRDHLCGSCTDGYQLPMDVHVGMYFTDMTSQHGPTQVIARSHRDPKRSPFAGCEPDSFNPRKQDAVLWDQRLWHRATKRTIEGTRIFALFGYYPIPSYAERPPRMCPSQHQAMLDAKDGPEQMLFGGLYPYPQGHTRVP